MCDTASQEVRKTTCSGNLLRFMDCIELILRAIHFSIILQSPLSSTYNIEVLRFRQGEGGLLSSAKVSEYN